MLAFTDHKVMEAQLNYWWMNTNPSSWNILEEMLPGDTEPWNAKGDAGRYKAHMKEVRPNDCGLCYQTHSLNAIVAELKAKSSLETHKEGKDVVRFRLERFLKPSIPWITIERSHIVDVKILRRSTLFRLTK